MKNFIGLALLFSSLAAAGNLLSVQVPRSSFQPLALSSLRAWGDCSDVSKVATTGANITTVTDKSVNAYTWSTGVSPTQVTNVQNGLSTCRFASTQYLTGSTGADITTGTICMLFKPSSLAQFDALWSSSGVPANSMILEIGASANKLDIWDSGGGAKAATGAGSIATGTWYRVCVASTQATPLATIYINNVSASTSAQASMFFKMANFNISKDNAANFTAFRGDIAEWIITTTVSLTDIGNIDTYWRAKWAL